MFLDVIDAARVAWNDESLTQLDANVLAKLMVKYCLTESETKYEQDLAIEIATSTITQLDAIEGVTRGKMTKPTSMAYVKLGSMLPTLTILRAEAHAAVMQATIASLDSDVAAYNDALIEMKGTVAEISQELDKFKQAQELNVDDARSAYDALFEEYNVALDHIAELTDKYRHAESLLEQYAGKLIDANQDEINKQTAAKYRPDLPERPTLLARFFGFFGVKS